MSGLPSPPMEEQKPARQPSKIVKHSSRTSKRATSTSHEHGPVSIDGRHKRVWKACERCRMKKTKCDGESPCKRCKDDGLVCTAGSRKKTEFKQLPRGYAEVLENTQYALIATVQKLYTMLRNNETWELGEPELNERGQPVIHDIASKLGCIRQSPDLPYSFPEGAEDFANLQAQLQDARSEMNSEDAGSRKQSEDLSDSPRLDSIDRASSTESDHSTMSKEYDQMMYRETIREPVISRSNLSVSKLTPLSISQRPSFDDDSSYQGRTSTDTSRSMSSPIYSEFQTASPTHRNTTPYSPWSPTAGNDFLSTTSPLELTGQYIGQPRMTGHSPLSNGTLMSAEFMKYNDGLATINFADGTIRPNMLDCDMYDQMEMIYTGDFDGEISMA